MKNNQCASIHFFLLISLVLSIPVVLLNIQYFDDIARTAVGYFGWDRDGRPLVDLIYKSISIGDKITDLYPIPQISSYLLLGYGCFLISSKFNLNGLYGIALTLPILCSPMLLGNTLFRYDSITMALSMFLCIIPFVISIKNKLLNYITSIILVGASLCLYQAALAVYIVLSITVCVISLINTKNIAISLQSLIKNAVITVCGYLLYISIIKMFFVMSPAAIKRSALISFNAEGLHSFINSSKLSISILFDGYGHVLLFISAIIIVLSLMNFNMRTIGSARQKLVISAICVILMLTAFFFTFALVALTKIPATVPRSYMAFGFFIFGINAFIFSAGLKKSSFILSLAISTIMISLNAQALTAVKVIDATQGDISKRVAYTLKENGKNLKDIIVVGKIKTPLKADEIFKSTPYVKGIIWMHLDNQFASYLVTLNGYPIGLPKKDTIKIVMTKKDSWNKLDSNSDYSLYTYNTHAILQFN